MVIHMFFWFLCIIGYIYLFSSALIIPRSQWVSLAPRLFYSLAGECDECVLTKEKFQTFSSFLGISDFENIFIDLDESSDGKLSWDELTNQNGPFSMLSKL